MKFIGTTKYIYNVSRMHLYENPKVNVFNIIKILLLLYLLGPAHKKFVGQRFGVWNMTFGMFRGFRVGIRNGFLTAQVFESSLALGIWCVANYWTR